MRFPGSVRAVALAAITVVVASSLAGAAQAQPAKWRQEVDGAVKQVLRQNPIPGAIVGIWRQGRKPYVQTFGVRSTASKKPMSPDLHMRIGSETKTFTATAVLQQVDQGNVGLDDPISKYVAGVPNGEGITIRQMLEMRSGLTSYTTVDAWANQFLAHPRAPWKPMQLLQFGFDQPPQFAPGTDYNYSNSNYVLLGLVVESVTGQDIGDYIEQEILKPSRMTQTLFPSGPEFPAPHADGITVQTLHGKRATTTHWNPSWAWSAGAMISTLADLHRWARIVATGQLLSPATQAQRTQFIPIPDVPSAAYGLGLVDIDGWIGHNGSLPGYESVTVHLPSRQMTMVVLINSDITTPTSEPSSLVGEAITKVISPAHVYELNSTALRPLTPAG